MTTDTPTPCEAQLPVARTATPSGLTSSPRSDGDLLLDCAQFTNTQRAAPSPASNRTTPADGAGDFSNDKLQWRIDRLQERCDALRGKPGYRRMLARLTDAKTAALARRFRNG